MCRLWSVLTIFVVGVIAFLMQHYEVDLSINKVFYNRYCQWTDKAGETSRKPRYDLAVGILSSRDHFDARAAIRETWLKELNANRRGRGWFVVGDTECALHPDNREDQYCCREWKVSAPVKSEDVQVVTTEKVSISVQQSGRDRKPVKVLHFKVMHPVMVSRIGLLEGVVVNTSAIQVSLYDRSTEEVLTTATFSGTDPGIPRGHFRFQPVDAVKLPKEKSGELSDRIRSGLTVPPNVRISATPNGWMTTIEVQRWISRVWGPNCDDVRRILTLDSYRPHTCPGTMTQFQKYDTDIVTIPGGCTGLIQPMDTHVNKVFKQRMRQQWATWFETAGRNKSRLGQLRLG